MAKEERGAYGPRRGHKPWDYSTPGFRETSRRVLFKNRHLRGGTADDLWGEKRLPRRSAMANTLAMLPQIRQAANLRRQSREFPGTKMWIYDPSVRGGLLTSDRWVDPRSTQAAQRKAQVARRERGGVSDRSSKRPGLRVASRKRPQRPAQARRGGRQEY